MARLSLKMTGWHESKSWPKQRKPRRVLGYEITDANPATLNFEGDPEAIKLVVDAHRLRNGHQFNKAFGLELSRSFPCRISAWPFMNTCCRKIRSGFCWPTTRAPARL